MAHGAHRHVTNAVAVDSQQRSEVIEASTSHKFADESIITAATADGLETVGGLYIQAHSTYIPRVQAGRVIGIENDVVRIRGVVLVRAEAIGTGTINHGLVSRPGNTSVVGINQPTAVLSISGSLAHYGIDVLPFGYQRSMGSRSIGYRLHRAPSSAAVGGTHIVQVAKCFAASCKQHMNRVRVRHRNQRVVVHIA